MNPSMKAGPQTRVWARPAQAIAGVALALVALSGCNTGGGKTGTFGIGGAVLQSVQYGRLVDVYAYRRVDPAGSDSRADTLNRAPVLIERDVVVRSDIEGQDLWDAAGNVREDSNYRFMAFDPAVGHEQLLILWDDRIPPESDKFQKAMSDAGDALPFVPAAHRGQDTSTRPIPIVPRNAALCLNFDRELDKDQQFFRANPNAIQLLEFISPLDTSQSGFRPIPMRVLSRGETVILDASLVGGEALGGVTTSGMPSSLDRKSANIRIALPTSGLVSRVIQFSEDNDDNFNDVDARGDTAVIRDFRSGNLADGAIGALEDFERPVIKAHLKMGITDVDMDKRILTINKRNHDAAIRGRVPYVDGALNNGVPAGPLILPLIERLRGGDIITQTVLSPIGEKVTVRAEVVMNLDVGNTPGDPDFIGLGMFRKGSNPENPADGGRDLFAHLMVTNMTAHDSVGNEVTFTSNAFPLGEDCEMQVHYYENVPYQIQFETSFLNKVSDAGRRHTFLAVDPPAPVVDSNGQVSFGKNVDPMSAIALRFSEGMDFETVDPFENFLLSNFSMNQANVLEVLDSPKASALSLIAANLLDHSGDGTLLMLRPPLGHFHVRGGAPNLEEEQYWFHMILGDRAPADMSGNRVDLYDRTPSPASSFSVQYEMAVDAQSNLVGSRVMRFAGQDEDGSAPGALDAFGQFQLFDGELRALPAIRFSRRADDQTLGAVDRFGRGECDVQGMDGMPPTPALSQSPTTLTGNAFECPNLNVTTPSVGGGVSEPHNQRGSRLQMTYREDDFGLSYSDPNEYLLDIEQMHWAPFNDDQIRFDIFDRYSLRLAHADMRPDLTFFIQGNACAVDCFSGKSGLSTVFDDNILQGSNYVTVIKDKTYEINPNDAFLTSDTNRKFIPYPKFERSFTWRDSRLVKWDSNLMQPVGLGGARDPSGADAVRDVTANVSAATVPDRPGGDPDDITLDFASLHTTTGFTLDYGDYLGFRARDFDPVALPLLMDFNLFPDGPNNGGRALGTNQFQIALMGPCFGAGNDGYYNQMLMPGCQGSWPAVRAHTTGGIDQITGTDILVNPETTPLALGAVVTDVLLGDAAKGLFKAPALDDHLNWAQADFVRRMSMVTFGFWDTMRPNAHGDFSSLNVNWSGLNRPNGTPNFIGLPDAVGVEDIVTMMDPPLSQQPVGTSLVVEYRGAKSFENDGIDANGQDNLSASVYDLATDFNALTSFEVVKSRGNLLNPFYAAEAYRYSVPSPMKRDNYLVHSADWADGARVAAEGLTPYVTEDRLGDLRSVNGLLPRYMNFRVIMANNLVADPPLSPALKSFAVVYRIGAGN